MAQKQATKEPKEKKSERRNILKKQVNLPVKGKLSRSVGVPIWLKAVARYFAGSWSELREVQWPTRRATWGLTGAVLIFTLALVAFILALDFGFEQLFRRILLQ